MKLCDTCIYRNNVEQLKPCIIYRDDCEYYERGDVFIADQCECENCVHEEMCKWKEERHGQECAYMQEPKTGNWIGHREHCENLGVMPSGLGAYEWCSNCDCGIDVREWHRNNYNYCPTCGCRMVEPQESEDKDADSN